jgi:hypothetical protein
MTCRIVLRVVRKNYEWASPLLYRHAAECGGSLMRISQRFHEQPIYEGVLKNHAPPAAYRPRRQMDAPWGARPTTRPPARATGATRK